VGSLLGRNLPLPLNCWEETCPFPWAVGKPLPLPLDCWEETCPFPWAVGKTLPLPLDCWEETCPFPWTAGKKPAPSPGLLGKPCWEETCHTSEDDAAHVHHTVAGKRPDLQLPVRPSARAESMLPRNCSGNVVLLVTERNSGL